MTIKDLRVQLAEIEIDDNNRMSLLEFLVFHYGGASWDALLDWEPSASPRAAGRAARARGWPALRLVARRVVVVDAAARGVEVPPPARRQRRKVGDRGRPLRRPGPRHARPVLVVIICTTRCGVVRAAPALRQRFRGRRRARRRRLRLSGMDIHERKFPRLRRRRLLLRPAHLHELAAVRPQTLTGHRLLRKFCG